MGAADKSEKQFMACRDVFAETVNVLLYGGKWVLCEELLQPAPTESFYIGRDGEQHNQFRDFCMYDIMDGAGVVRAVYLEENQSRVDQKMPLREAGYQGAAYRSQYRQVKGQGVYPVISMVLNWGNKPWNGARSTREQFEGDMRIVLDYLSDRESLTKRNQKPRNPEELMRMLHALSGDGRYLKNIPFMKVEGERKMCDLLDEMVEKGIRQGRKEGLEAGRREGLKRGKKEGRKEGIKEGKREGKKEGIKAVIIICQELGVGFEETASKVKLRFHLTEKETKKSMKLYW